MGLGTFSLGNRKSRENNGLEFSFRCYEKIPAVHILLSLVINLQIFGYNEDCCKSSKVSIEEKGMALLLE